MPQIDLCKSVQQFATLFRQGKITLGQLQAEISRLAVVDSNVMNLLAAMFRDAAKQPVPNGDDIENCSMTAQRRRSIPSNYKIRPCKYVYNATTGQFNYDDSTCKYGSNCHFAHTQEELERHQSMIRN